MNDSAHLPALQEKLGSLAALDVLKEASLVFGERLALASSLGAEDQVLTDMLTRVAPRVSIFTLDTGRLPQETYDLIDATRKRYGIEIEVLFPDRQAVEAMVNQKGANLFYHSVDSRKACCHVRKVVPLRRKLAGLDAWITGLRREQAVTRRDVQTVEWDEANGLFKINPLADWTADQVWEYIRRNYVPYSALHDKGYPSLGCAPCTRAVAPGEDLRAGRWWWESPEHKECGLHVVDGKLMRRRFPAMPCPIQNGMVRVPRATSCTPYPSEEAMNHLEALEAQSVFILREAYREFKQLVMLWSIGKDSTVLLWLARKAFFGHVPIPLMHIDTCHKIPQMIEYRDRLAREWKLNLIFGRNDAALAQKRTFPDGNATRLQCCASLKSEALKKTLSGEWPRWTMDHRSGQYVKAEGGEPFTGVIVGVRADEEGSRSKERYFSPRDQHNEWDVADQPPELWNYFKTDFAPGTHVRVHPLLDWTELNIWEYIEAEGIPVIPLYFDHGSGQRYRSLGCGPCTKPVFSTARNVRDIIEELRMGKFANIAERSGREQDKEDGQGLETLRREGYM